MKADSWFRVYTRILDNPKLQTMDPSLFRQLINFWSLAKLNGGVLPTASEIAWRLRTTESQILSDIEALMDRKYCLLEKIGRSIRPTDFEEWQTRKPSSSDRVKRYREARSSAGLTVAGYTVHRELLMERDGGVCVYCGAKVNLVIDHLIPVSKGGDDEPENLAISCKPCNASKAGMLLEEWGKGFNSPHMVTIYADALSRAMSRDNVNAKRVHVTPGVTYAVTGESHTEEKRGEERRTPPTPLTGGGASTLELQSAPTRRFVKPTPAEVEAYALSITFPLVGQTFIDFYESKGWRVGQTPMKDWKAAVRTWKQRRTENAGASVSGAPRRGPVDLGDTSDAN